MIVSALSPTQSKQVEQIKALPAVQQKEAIRALLNRTFNPNARHTIRCIFNM
jgi:hypothetical protein